MSEQKNDTQPEVLDTYNPESRPVDELPFIYGFNNGGQSGFWLAVALAADGKPLGSHMCSDESFMPGDLGLTPESRREDRRAAYREHYPQGYRTTFVSYDDVDGCEGLQAAFVRSDEGGYTK